jgi:Phosphopantetheine attachment site/AMP-binding enzyme C-terminal domain
VAYVVPSDPDRPPRHEDLKLHLSGRLPAYMVPNGYLTLPRLPRTVSGKVNPAALPDPVVGQVVAQVRRAPANDLERGIARVWAAVLAVNEVGVDENFFDLGGHSLLLGQLSERINDELGLQVGVLSFFEYPTVSALAAAFTDGDARDGEAERSALRDEQRRMGRRRLGARRALQGADHD